LMNEPAEGAIMKKPPRDLKKHRLLDMKLVAYSYLFYANITSIGCFYTYFIYMADRGNTRAVPNPVPADDDGQRVFPAGYRVDQLMHAWNWGLDTGNLGKDEVAAANVGSTIFYVVILTAQMGHLLSIRRKTPYFYDAIMNTKASEKQYNALTTTGENEAARASEVSDKNVLFRIWDELRNSEIRWPIVAAWVGAILTAMFWEYVPVFQKYCGTAPVPGKYWGIAIGWSLLWFVVAEIRKWLVFLFPDSWIGKTAW